MATGLGIRNSAVGSQVPDGPKLLVELEAPHRVFFSNLRDSFRHSSSQQPSLHSAAEFWPDVFVQSRLPWSQMLESVLLHIVAVIAVVGLSRMVSLRPTMQYTAFHKSDVIYYSPSEYLPPINTGSAPARVAQAGDPEYAKQPIISVPGEADNRTQTIITPPDIKLPNEVAVPNIVAWDSALPAVPLPAAQRSAMPAMQSPVVAPAPSVTETSARRVTLSQVTVIEPPPDASLISNRRRLESAEGGVIAPPPTVETLTQRHGDISIADAQVVAPAPLLPMEAQRSLAQATQSWNGTNSAQVVPPPPEAQGTGSASGRRIIALGLHPAAGPPPENIAGNRHGSFAATPGGKAGAAGTPKIIADSHGAGEGGRGTGKSGAGGTGDGRSAVPAGVFVGAPPSSAPTASISGGSGGDTAGTGNEVVAAKASPPADIAPMHVTVKPHRVLTPGINPTPVEREIFGNRKFYSMMLNIPNLNSAGGSWIVRFAEAKVSSDKADLTAPEPTHKVDPAYPLALMRMHLEGTVTLYAVIRDDGTVGNVKVLTSLDDRLDEYARVALSGWKFIPATRNGTPVELEAVFMIPFRAKRAF
jgi:TonB family protein